MIVPPIPAGCFRLPPFFTAAITALLGFGSATANEPPLTGTQVAQLAYDAGFRGGSLLAAVAAAAAESSYDPDAVCNNLHVLNGAGQPTYYPNGKPILAAISSYDGTMLPLGQIQALPGGGQGRVVSHCRGLWQINSTSHNVPNVEAFSPAMSARRAWGISRKGRFWGKWTSVMTGTAWEPTRLAAARTAARAVDPTVLPNGTVAGLRVETWTAGGGVRSSAAGAFLRPIVKGDTGTILNGPVIASITQGIQTSKHLWYQIQWDHGTTGWVIEEYLTQRTTPTQNASPAYNPTPQDNTVRIPQTGTTLNWTIGGNTKNIQLRFGTDPALTAAGTLKINSGIPTSWPTGPLEHYRNYYWRIDAESGNGTITQGPTWTFRTTPQPAQPIAFSNIQVSPIPAVVGQLVTISGQVSAPGPQGIIIGADIGGVSDKPNDRVFNVPGGNVPTSFSRSFQLTTHGLGDHNLEIAAWQDVNQNGAINFGDVRIRTDVLYGAIQVRDLAKPTFSNLSASPATINQGQQVNLSATVSDTGGSGLQGVFFYRSFGENAPGGWAMIAYRPTTGNGPVTLTAQDNPWNEGRYWYQALVRDAAGNETYLSAPSTVRVQIPDLAPPVVQWQHPTNGSTINGGITVSGQATDDRGVASVQYRINNGAWALVSSSFSQWSFFFDPVQGTNVLEARATDTAGKVSITEPLYLYYPGSEYDSTVFNERFGFDGDQVHPRWQLFTSGNSSENGVMNGRLQSASGGSATIRAQKTVPAWANAVELRFTADTGSGVEWNDNAFRTWRVRLRESPMAVEIGHTNNFQQILLNNPANPGAKIRTLWTDGKIHLWYLPSQAAPIITQEISLPLLKLSNLSGRMEFQSQTNNFGTQSTLDDIQLRALRPADQFSIQSHDLKPGQTSKVRWLSFVNRNYVIEGSADLQSNSWSLLGQGTASGLITEQTFSMPTGNRRFVRVRETP